LDLKGDDMQPETTPTQNMTIRPAAAADRRALATLAQLDSVAPVFDAVLVAELDGSIVAAITADGGALADPFRHTEGIVDFMRSETAARMLGTTVRAPRTAQKGAGYARRRRSRRYWRANAATNAGL
jgi:hypothetical protein